MDQTQVNKYRIGYKPVAYVETPCELCGNAMSIKRTKRSTAENRLVRCVNKQCENHKKYQTVTTPLIDQEHFEI